MPFRNVLYDPSFLPCPPSSPFCVQVIASVHASKLNYRFLFSLPFSPLLASFGFDFPSVVSSFLLCFTFLPSPLFPVRPSPSLLLPSLLLPCLLYQHVFHMTTSPSPRSTDMPSGKSYHFTSSPLLIKPCTVSLGPKDAEVLTSIQHVEIASVHPGNILYHLFLTELLSFYLYSLHTVLFFHHPFSFIPSHFLLPFSLLFRPFSFISSFHLFSFLLPFLCFRFLFCLTLP